MVKRDPLKEIMGSPLEPIPYSSHPSDAVLRDYIQGRLSQSSSLDVAALQAGRLSTWHRAEVTAHLLTCPECAHFVRQLRAEPSPHRLQAFFEKLWPKRAPVPMFARVIMLAQFVIILCLAGVIYFKPAPFFSALSPTASVPPSSEITKKPAEQAPPTPHPQQMVIEPSDDPMVELVQSHPVTIHVAFREDTPMRELANLLQSVNGILIWMHSRGFVVRLSRREQLDSVLEKLSQSPYIIEARKD
jgi:hypothetical protein